MEVDLTDKTALVTGAGRGIGAEIATQFAGAGANVVLAARTASEIEATAKRCEGMGVDALAVPTDLREADDVDALVDATVETFGAPAVLVNNAAANLAGAPLDLPVEDVDTMLDVNLRGLFLLSQRVGSEQVAAGVDGRIVNVSSVVADVGVPAMTFYGGTKAGVNGLTRGLAAELSPHGITVNSVNPGMTRVERIERLMAEKGDIYDLDRIPVGRLADPEEVASVCVFLASEHASYITGVALPVDGGVGITAGLYR